MALQPAAAGSQNSIQTEGVWSFFKLLDRASVGKARRDAFEISFSIGGRTASFSLQAGSVLNPFSLPALRGFGCPASM